jgi:hypothetical protein
VICGDQPFDWTERRVAALRAMDREGVSFGRIAEALGCTKNAAVSKAHRLNLPRRGDPTPRRNAQPQAPKPQPLRSGAATLPPLPSEQA